MKKFVILIVLIINVTDARKRCFPVTKRATDSPPVTPSDNPTTAYENPTTEPPTTLATGERIITFPSTETSAVVSETPTESPTQTPTEPPTQDPITSPSPTEAPTVTVTEPPTEPSTETTTTIQPCGTFLKYDSVNAPDDPVTKGFAGGFDLQNSTAYVGYGNVTCNNQMPLPGYILASPPSPKKSGVYITCNTGEQFSDTTGFYLLNHPDLTYVPSNSTSLWSIEGSLKVQSTSYVFCFGRFFYGGRYVLGKVRNTDATGRSSTMFYNTPGGEVQTSDYEVLTCKSQA